MGERIDRYQTLIAGSLLFIMFILGLFTMLGDSAIVDEIAHIPAGYSYVAFHDYRLNPEHPPLIKDLAGLPLLLLNLNFPTDNVSWTSDVNGQWEAGWHFLYHYGNPAEIILFMARLPILLLAVLFGWIMFAFCRKEFGVRPALLILFLYALSPNFLGHNHLVTTDLGIAAFTFIALATFARFLSAPSPRSLALATVGLALVQAAKFSAVLLIPFYAGIFLLLLIFGDKAIALDFGLSKRIRSAFWRRLTAYALSYAIMVVGSFLLVWIFYAFHTYNFPPDKQIELIRGSLPDNRASVIRDILIWMAPNAILQPLAQYLLGVAMVFSRVAGGNTTFFLGEVSNQSFKWYFPVSYFLKEPIGFLVLLSLSGVIWFRAVLMTPLRSWWKALASYATKRRTRTIFLLFVLYYGGISIAGNLNLGIRHLFPILPLIWILVSDSVLRLLNELRTKTGRNIAYSFLGLMVFWYGISSLLAFPHYISYFNEIIGGGKNAYKYFTDSNVDWGQDLTRLADWMDEHPEVNKLKLDYFGGGEPKYYFCKRAYDAAGALIRTSSGYDCQGSRYIEWHSRYGKTNGWIAVSVTFLQNAKFYAERYHEQDYDWLRNREPYAKIGNSIFVYYIQ